MKFTSCFLGIPLAEEFLVEFESLLGRLKQIDVSVETVDPNTPHVTIYYLDTQTEVKISEISSVVEREKDILKGTRISIGNLGYFKNKNIEVIYLEVEVNEKLTSFNERMKNILNDYYAKDDNLAFQPHLTLARVRGKIDKEKWYEIKDKIDNLTREVKWEFDGDLGSICSACRY